MRQLSAIMFTDISGYTRLMQSDEKLAIEARKTHRTIFEEQHQLHGGRIVQYYGDGTLSVFKSAVKAVECAVKMQQDLKAEQVNIPVKMAIHTGDIVFDDTEIYGDGVNLTARIESISEAGAVLISEKLHDEIKNHKHITTVYMGHYDFKNVSDPVGVYAIANKGLHVPEARQNGSAHRPVKSIAVLPFVNMSNDPDNGYFCDGITEEIINALTKINALKVSSRTSSFHYRDTNYSLKEIGQALNVSTILEGSVRLHKKRIRITAQLIDARDDFHFWSETFDRTLDNIFEVQDEVSVKIAEKLREHIGHFPIKEHLVEDPGISFSDYSTYLKSRYHILKMKASEIEHGMQLLRDLIKSNPSYTYAYLGMHLGYTLMATLGLWPASKAFAEGAAYIQKAFELDPDLPECRLQMAWTSLLQQWNLPECYNHLQKVEHSKPLVDYYQSMASVTIIERRYDTAMRYIDEAIQLDPFSDVNAHLKAFILYTQKEYKKAEHWYRRSMELKPDSELSILELGQCLLLMEKHQEAETHFSQLPASESKLIRTGGLAMVAAWKSNVEDTEKYLDQLSSALESEQMERALHLMILVHAILDQKKTVIELLKKGLEFKLPMLLYLMIDPIMSRMTGHDEVLALIANEIEFSDGKQDIKSYKNPLLSKTQMKAHRKALLEHMKLNKPYLDAGLTLSTLGTQIGLQANEMSQLLNAGFDKNFSEFINEYRVQEFKRRAGDPNNQHLTILANAMDSGFNSKTVFNTFFKKMTGQTPRQYVNSREQ